VCLKSVTRQDEFLAGYFASVHAINDHRRPIELVDLLIEQPADPGARICRGAGFGVR